MDQNTPPNWNFFGTVERLIKATEALIDERPEKTGDDQDLVRNMVMRLTVIMEDSAGYLAQEEQGRRTLLENRLNSIRSRLSPDHMIRPEAGRERNTTGHNVRQLGRVTH
ncbi:hypothetical protein [Nisaea nitritireducens]|uniref:hypothetical protein n=1 Tax=Nisaea nitritireducens TaxID=568392 RepID=UPI0018695D61|nr:hypothetical protein [Nisaea nitritireducens]